MKRTHKPYQEYFLVAKSSDLAGNNTALFTNNAINLADGQLGILDVSDNTFVTKFTAEAQV